MFDGNIINFTQTGMIEEPSSVKLVRKLDIWEVRVCVCVCACVLIPAKHKVYLLF